VVKEAFLHSWLGYKEYAWLHDEYMPLSGGYNDQYGGWAATLVDNLDTLWIMGLREEFDVAVAALQTVDFTWSVQPVINVFETTIRYLGGLLSTHDLTGGQYHVVLDKAIEVAEFIYQAFDTPNRMPVARWDWRK
jgi:mannosyl-oligosaccharide alpha-1,2-mannosidase